MLELDPVESWTEPNTLFPARQIKENQQFNSSIYTIMTMAEEKKNTLLASSHAFPFSFNLTS